MPPDEDRGGPAGAPPGGGSKWPGLGGGTPSGGSTGPGPRGVPSKTVLLAAVGIVLAGVWALSGLGVIDATMLFPEDGGDATRLVTADKLGDCREARLDTGEGCEPGADVESVAVWWPDRNTLGVELKLTESPDLAEGSEWTAELFAETANAFTDNGLICGLSTASPGPDDSSETANPNSPPNPDNPDNPPGTADPNSDPLPDPNSPPDSDSPPGAADPNSDPPPPELIAYALASRFAEDRLGPEACDASLLGTSVRFTIDVTGQPETDELRIIGTVRLEYPTDPTQPGSDDDFLVRTSLHELR